MEFSSPMYTVDEGNGTVTVCLTTNTAIAQPLTVTVIPLQKAHGNIATGMSLYTHINSHIFPFSSRLHTALTYVATVGMHVHQ